MPDCIADRAFCTESQSRISTELGLDSCSLRQVSSASLSQRATSCMPVICCACSQNVCPKSPKPIKPARTGLGPVWLAKLFTLTFFSLARRAPSIGPCAGQRGFVLNSSLQQSPPHVRKDRGVRCVSGYVPIRAKLGFLVPKKLRAVRLTHISETFISQTLPTPSSPSRHPLCHALLSPSLEAAKILLALPEELGIPPIPSRLGQHPPLPLCG